MRSILSARRCGASLWIALAFVLLAPTALAVDLLPTEIRFGDTEARVLVRSAGGAVRIETEPSVLAAPAPPGGAPAEFVPTPRAFEAAHEWRGIDGMVEIVLKRPSGSGPVDIVIEDDARTGVWLEWPAAQRQVPLPVALLLLSLSLVARLRR